MAWDVPLAANQFAVGDLNDDGFPDMVVAGFQTFEVRILWGGPSGLVSSTDSLRLDPFHPYSIETGDVDGDGVTDLIVGLGKTTANEVRVFRGSSGDVSLWSSFALSGQPWGVTCADLNSDGHPDLGLACYSANVVAVALNLGNGTAWSVTNLSAASGPQDIVAIDTGSDGLLELVVSNTLSTVSLFRNLGSGQFGSRVDYPVGLTGIHVSAGDLNGDGLVDAVVAESNTSLSVLYGVAPDSFAAWVYLPIVASDVLIADANGDLRPDLITTNAGSYSFEWEAYTGNEVAVRLQEGDGTLGQPWRGVSGNQPLAPHLVDMNLDQRLDLVAINARSNSIDVLLGNGDGTFGLTRPAPVDTVPADMAVGDLNNNSIPDVVTANASAGRSSVLLGMGDGTFVQGPPAQVSGENAVVLGDLTGDGVLDMVTADRDANMLTVLRGLGGGAFTTVGTLTVSPGPVSLALGDLTGDNKFDLIVASVGTYNFGCDCYQQGNTLSVFAGRGDGTFDPPSTYPTQQGPGALAIADMNGDGKKDVVLTTPGAYGNVCLCWKGANGLSVYLNNGTGGFSNRIDKAVGIRPVGLAVTDFNSDGKLDVAIAHAGLWAGTSCFCYQGNGVVTLLGNGNGTFTPDTVLTAGASPSSVIAQDLTGDGVTDLGVANFVGNSVSLFQGVAPGTFLPKQDFGVGSGPIALRSADLNGDARADLLTVNQWTYTVSVLMNETGGPTSVFAASTEKAHPRVSVERRGRAFAFAIELQGGDPPTAEIYDLTGKRVARLVVGGVEGASSFTTTWAGTDTHDRAVASGVYFLRVRSGSRSTTLKVPLTR